MPTAFNDLCEAIRLREEDEKVIILLSMVLREVGTLPIIKSLIENSNYDKEIIDKAWTYLFEEDL